MCAYGFPGERRAQAVTAVDASPPTPYDRAAPSHARVRNCTHWSTAYLRRPQLVYNRASPMSQLWTGTPSQLVRQQALEAALLRTACVRSLCSEGRLPFCQL